MSSFLIYVLLSVPFVGAYAMFALGIVVIYRASRVLNLAHGAMAMIPAYLMYSMSKAGVPVLLALPLAVISGGLLGVGVERIFVRRLRGQGPTAQTVGTVAVTGLLIAVAAKVWGTTPRLAPQIFPKGAIRVGASGIRYGELGLFGIAIVVSAAAFAFFRYTEYGLAMRGAAQNRRAAALMGIDPDLAAAAAWALGGALAALAGVLLAAVTNLDPYTLSLQVLPAFIAALIGGLESLPGALIGAAIAGVSFGVVPFFSRTPIIGTLARQSGSPQLALTILVLVIMGIRGRRIVGADTNESALYVSSGTVRAARARTFGRGMIFLVALAIAWPWIVPYSVLGTSLQWIELSLVAASLVVLTGWVGQISLAQASFVGITALTTGLVTRGLHLGFPASLIIGAAASAAAAVGLGVVALRVRGLYLAVATLIFAWMCDTFLFRTTWLGASSGTSTIPAEHLGRRGGIPYLDLTDRRTLFYLFVVVLGLVLFALANLRTTKTGRAFFAVRGSEMAAAALGIDVVRTKLVAFAIAGAVAGVAGNLLMVRLGGVVPNQFLYTISLQYLAIAVVGGLGSLGGAVAAGALFAALDELFFRVTALAGWLDVVSAGLLAVVLLAYPGGLAAVLQTGYRIVDRIRAVVERRRPARTEPDQLEAIPISANGAPSTNGHREHGGGLELNGFAAPALADRAARPAVLEAEHVVVRFGGLTAVNGASLAVHEGEVAGLIGPNGAGKTTLFNAILGLNTPVEGHVSLYGRDVTALPPHLRARMGVARTFQVLQLFAELTVFENLLVATHLHNESGVLSNLVASPRTVAAELAARTRAREILRLLSLEDIASQSVRGLPFGVLRMVELGRALVTGARLIMLDEPASGLNDAETDKLTEVIAGIRGLGVSVLLIEHDVRMVTRVCDYIYVLDQGQLIAEGPPDTVQRDARVVAAYLGEPAEPAHV